ncbi:MAG: hypothetical protein HZA34_04805 [Candidatus Pacebacteria bacterium]|nr:hypothetical protein [Candidatus Paceibacterota bacterium]
MKLLKPFTQQFKTFLAKSYSKPFIVICLLVTGIGAVNSLYVVSNLKDSIDTKITQRQEELGKLFDEQDTKAEAEYQIALQKYNQCLQNYKESHPGSDSSYIPNFLHGCGSQPFRAGYSVIGDTIFGNRYPARYLEDSYYRELIRVKDASSSQLFFEKLGLGWWGLIALAAVFLINILIIVVKFLKSLVPIFIGGSRNAKINVGQMPAFQRYVLLIVLLILITLVFIFIKL